MSKYLFNPTQALLLSDYTATVWLLQACIQLENDNRAVSDVLYIITRFVFNITNDDMEIRKVRDTMADIRVNYQTKIRQRFGLLPAPITAIQTHADQITNEEQQTKPMDLSH
jgi:hypothetical protein